MPNEGTTVQCPFYIKSNQTTIYCESNVSVEQMEEEPERSYAHIFANAAQKKKFIREHCGRYPNMGCPYADYMEREYAGGKHEGKRKAEKSKQATGKSGKNDCRAAKRNKVSARRMRNSKAGSGRTEG